MYNHINHIYTEVLFIMWKHGIWMYREYGFAFGCSGFALQGFDQIMSRKSTPQEDEELNLFADVSIELMANFGRLAAI